MKKTRPIPRQELDSKDGGGEVGITAEYRNEGRDEIAEFKKV